MWAIVRSCIGWLVNKALLFMLLLAILVGVAWVRAELGNAAGRKVELDGLTKERLAVVQDLRALDTKKIQLEREIHQLGNKLHAELEKLFGYRNLIEQQRDSLEAELAELNKTMMFRLLAKVPGTEAFHRRVVLETQISILRETAQQANATVDRVKSDPRWQALVKHQKWAEEVAAEIVGKMATAEGLKRSVDKAQREYDEIVLKQESFDTVAGVVRSHVWTAVGLLALITVVPALIRTFLYFIVAPLASRVRPIQLLPSSSGRLSAQGIPTPVGKGGLASAVSLPITLPASRELLVRSAYLQSAPVEGVKRTKWFLNHHLPLSSILAGMVQLTRISGTGNRPVVVSSQDDAMVELGLVELPPESAMVCQPRALAGVVKEVEHDVKISRHWRLASLHGWLTLQLRFLVFHGPCGLILRGCRGVRIEPAGSGRLINQAATLGFSANLDYSNSRCETFVPYLLGQQGLFNDRFGGSRGFYAYEEVPSSGRRSGGIGRRLEGLVDGFLKAFGI